MKFHASGKWTEEHDFAIDIAPDTIRDMFGRVIDDCLERQNEGGYITKYLDRVVQWMLNPNSEFPGEPGNLQMRKLPISSAPQDFPTPNPSRMSSICES